MNFFIYIFLLCHFNFISAFMFCKTLTSWALTCNLTQNLDLDVSNTMVHLYDTESRLSANFKIDTAVKGIISTPKLNKTKKFYVYVHGFMSNIDEKSVKQMVEKLLQIPNTYLIVIDHSAYMKGKIATMIADYKRSVTYLSAIGKRVAQMLAELDAYKIPVQNMHCIGHSLGGQMLGYVGEQVKKLTKKTIGRITAIDPAGPCFEGASKDLQVRSGVAKYVEVYHCNTDCYGSKSILGDVDFFINSGKYQQYDTASCMNKLTRADTYSHTKCVKVYAVSILRSEPFVAYKCDTYKEFKSDKCKNNSQTIAGFGNPGKAKGKYYFSTKGEDVDCEY